MQIILFVSLPVNVPDAAFLHFHHLLAIKVVLDMSVESSLHGSAEQVVDYFYSWMVMQFHSLSLGEVVDCYSEGEAFVDVA